MPRLGPYLFSLFNIECAIFRTSSKDIGNNRMNNCVSTISLRNKMLPVPLSSLCAHPHLGSKTDSKYVDGNTISVGLLPESKCYEER